MRVKYPCNIEGKKQYELYGKAVIVMPNCFVIAGTFKRDRIVKGLHLMLWNDPNGKSFVRKLTHSFPLLVQDSNAINGFLFDNETLINVAISHAHLLLNLEKD